MAKAYRYMVNWHNQEVEEDEDGDLVEWIDYQELAERCERLEAALRVYNSAKSMSRYGDYSGFEFPKREMRRPGESAWGWICEKHGLSYGGGCICCEDDYKVFCTRKDSEARNARNDALNAAFNAAEILLRERTP